MYRVPRLRVHVPRDALAHLCEAILEPAGKEQRLTEHDGAAAIEFDQGGQNVAWLDGFEFASSTIDLDAALIVLRITDG